MTGYPRLRVPGSGLPGPESSDSPRLAVKGVSVQTLQIRRTTTNGEVCIRCLRGTTIIKRILPFTPAYSAGAEKWVGYRICFINLQHVKDHAHLKRMWDAAKVDGFLQLRFQKVLRKEQE